MVYVNLMLATRFCHFATAKMLKDAGALEIKTHKPGSHDKKLEL